MARLLDGLDRRPLDTLAKITQHLVDVNSTGVLGTTFSERPDALLFSQRVRFVEFFDDIGIVKIFTGTLCVSGI